MTVDEEVREVLEAHIEESTNRLTKILEEFCKQTESYPEGTMIILSTSLLDLVVIMDVIVGQEESNRLLNRLLSSPNMRHVLAEAVKTNREKMDG